MPEFYVIFARKMPKCYMIIARKIFFPTPMPVSPKSLNITHYSSKCVVHKTTQKRKLNTHLSLPMATRDRKDARTAKLTSRYSLP